MQKHVFCHFGKAVLRKMIWEKLIKYWNIFKIMIICLKYDKIVIVCHKITQNIMRQQRIFFHIFMKTWFWGRNGRQNRKFSVFWRFIPTVVRAITRFEKIVISFCRCCGPQKIEKILKIKNMLISCVWSKNLDYL